MSDDGTNGITWRNKLWGEIAVKGRELILIMCIALLGAILYMESKETHLDHKDILCLLRLQIWTAIAKEEDLSLRRLPREYWVCLPEGFGRIGNLER